MFWFLNNLTKWIKNGCDKTIGNMVISLDISNNQLTKIPPEVNNLINLRYFNCSNNKISILSICNLINLKTICCENNKIKIIPKEIKTIINLTFLNCSQNELTILPLEIGNLINLEQFWCCNNNLTTLPLEIGNLINLKDFYCSNNKLNAIPNEIGNLFHLQKLNCINNNLTTLPSNLCDLIHLKYLIYSGNPIEYINPQIIRILNKHESIQKIYDDPQSVHNYNIQEGIKNSIQYIMSIKPVIDNLNELITNNEILTKQTKNILFNFCKNTTIHTELNITFGELLLNVYNLALLNPCSNEIFAIMNIEILDSYHQCFTGRISRLVNCLNGFDDNIKINISNNEQIGNIIILIKNKLTEENRYTYETHKKLVIENLLDKKYDIATINEWLNYL